MSDKETCPYCKEDVKAGAVKCKHCHSKLAATSPEHEGICPFCKEEIKPDAIKCKHCKSNLTVDSSCKCSSNEEDDITKIQGQMAPMGNIRPAASSSISKNFGEGPSLGDCTFHCFRGPDKWHCYWLCEGPIETSFTNRLSTFF